VKKMTTFEKDPRGPIARELETDHVALGLLLEQAMSNPFQVDEGAYAAFRAGLLRHIAAEEQVLLPAARRANDDSPIPQAAEIKRGHAALAALLVPSPTRRRLLTLARVLDAHVAVEEGLEGAFAVSERLIGGDAEAVLDRIHSVPRVRLAPYRNSPLVERHIGQLVRAALPADGGPTRVAA
jgi:hypothetical protein